MSSSLRLPTTQTLQTYISALSTYDVELIISCYSQSATFRDPFIPLSRKPLSRNGIYLYLQRMKQTMSDVRFETQEIGYSSNYDKVFLKWRMMGTVVRKKGSGSTIKIPVELRGMTYLKMDWEGKIEEEVDYFDPSVLPFKSIKDLGGPNQEKDSVSKL